MSASERRVLVEEAFQATAVGGDTLTCATAAVEDVPVPWLIEAVRVAKRMRGLKPEELRTQCAFAVLRARANVRGDKSNEVPRADQIDVDGIIRWVRENAPLGWSQLASIEAKKRSESGQGSRESAPSEPPATPGQVSTGAALTGVLASIAVDKGLQETINAIWREGKLVPSHRAKVPDSTFGKHLATILAHIRHRLPPVSNGFFTDVDLDILHRAMERFASEPEADVSWWKAAKPQLEKLCVKYDAHEQRGQKQRSVVPEIVCRRVYVQLWGDAPREDPIRE